MASLSKTQLNNLNKPDLLQYTMDLQTKFNESRAIADKLDTAIADIQSLNHTVTMLESTLKISQNVNNKLQERIINLERETSSNAQYSRRECIEIAGIPDSVSNNDLEDKVCEIFQAIDVNVKPRHIHACHRLKNSDRSIIKFISRKNCINVLKNRKKLENINKSSLGFSKHTKLYINESLCPRYKFILWKCRTLHKEKLLDSYWTFNGTVKIRINENDEDSHAITHINDLKDRFKDYDFDAVITK